MASLAETYGINAYKGQEHVLRHPPAQPNHNKSQPAVSIQHETRPEKSVNWTLAIVLAVLGFIIIELLLQSRTNGNI